MDTNKLRDLIRVGRVSSVNPQNCTARVTFPDKDDMVSAELPIISIGSKGTQAYWLPAIDAQVLCIFTPNSSGKGLNDGFIIGCFYSTTDMPVIGCFYSTTDMPAENDEKVVSINLSDGSYIRFDSGNVEIYASKSLKLTAPRIDLN